MAWARQLGLRPPRLYDLGLPHNSCGGACVRAGKSHWARLLHVLPDHYAAAEAAENQLREQLGDVAILTEQRQRQRHRLPLSELRHRLTTGHQP